MKRERKKMKKINLNKKSSKKERVIYFKMHPKTVGNKAHFANQRRKRRKSMNLKKKSHQYVITERKLYLI